MDLLDVSRREKRQAFVTAIVLVVALSIVAAPAVPAAVQAIKGTVAIKDNNSSTKANIKSIAAQGLTDAPGSAGAVDVRNFAGGAGFLGFGICSAPGGVNTVELNGGNVVTSVLVTGGAGRVDIDSAALPEAAGNALEVQVTDEDRNVVADLTNGLAVTHPLKFTATATGAAGCRFVVLGHGPGDTQDDNA